MEAKEIEKLTDFLVDAISDKVSRCCCDIDIWDDGLEDLKEIIQNALSIYQPERSKREDPKKGCGALNSMET